MSRVVDKLNLDVDYTTKEKLHSITLYGKELPFQVLFQKQYKGKRGQHIDVVKKGSNTVTLKGMTDRMGNDVPDVDVQLGQMTQTPYGPLCVVRGPGFGRWTDETIEVDRLSKEKAAARFLKMLSASEYDKETSLIVLNCNDTNVERADQVLATLYDTYKEDVVENKTAWHSTLPSLSTTAYKSLAANSAASKTSWQVSKAQPACRFRQDTAGHDRREFDRPPAEPAG